MGAGLVVTLESYLASTSLPVPVVIGCIFVVCVLLFRRGIVGEIVARSARGRKPS
ncbi:ABC-type branched-subunit amino acid transport system permease subunit [Azospirillum melinis]|nr:ABC-type branched-subunit amino acid transport system permease subunit [Azospirillum melinis]